MIGQLKDPAGLIAELDEHGSLLELEKFVWLLPEGVAVVAGAA